MIEINEHKNLSSLQQSGVSGSTVFPKTCSGLQDSLSRKKLLYWAIIVVMIGMTVEKTGVITGFPFKSFSYGLMLIYFILVLFIPNH